MENVRQVGKNHSYSYFYLLKPTAALEPMAVFGCVLQVGQTDCHQVRQTAFYGVVCQLQTYAVLLLLARLFIRLLLDYFFIKCFTPRLFVLGALDQQCLC